MAMELLEGESLAARLQSSRSRAPKWVASVITQVARALGQAHTAGIVHRDLKPANIFLVRNDDDELVKLLDFGVAKAADGLATGSVLGTPYYMSPEQVNAAKHIDHRTDLWSLGVIACECMTGHRPFAADTLSELAMKIALGRSEVPSRLGPVPSDFDAWFKRATEVDPAQRFQSAGELARALNEVAGSASRTPMASPEPEFALAATLESNPLSIPSTSADFPGANTTNAGTASLPSRPRGEGKGRVGRRVLWASAVGLGLLGARYSNVFDSSNRTPEPAAIVAEPAPHASTASENPGASLGAPASLEKKAPIVVEATPTPAANPPIELPLAPATEKKDLTRPKPRSPAPKSSPGRAKASAAARQKSDTLDAYDVQ